MAKHRDKVQELLDIKARNKRGTRSYIFYSRFRPLDAAFKADGFKDELVRYFPIGLIALVEAYFKAVYAELLNLGEPYASRAEPLVKDLKLDWRAIRAIEGRKITSGEMIAHLLPLSSLGDIQWVMNALLGEDFLGRLRNVENHMYSLGEISKGVSAKRALPEPDDTFKAVARTFELRHIFCHEAAIEVALDKNEIRTCLTQCTLFLSATESLMVKIYYPKPLSQFELTEKADKEYRNALMATQSVEKHLQKTLGAYGRELLEDAQQKWKQSSAADAEFSTHLWKGGSGHGMARLWALKEDADIRRERLAKYIEEFPQG